MPINQSSNQRETVQSFQHYTPHFTLLSKKRKKKADCIDSEYFGIYYSWWNHQMCFNHIKSYHINFTNDWFWHKIPQKLRLVNFKCEHTHNPFLSLLKLIFFSYFDTVTKYFKRFHNFLVTFWLSVCTWNQHKESKWLCLGNCQNQNSLSVFMMFKKEKKTWQVKIVDTCSLHLTAHNW